ncbi:MAG: DUF5916 domain-containing protein [candidate division Zixibacteria bacterium]
MRLLMKFYGFWGLVLILSTSTIVAADDDYEPVFHPKIHISRAPGEIKIDGVINDPGWKNAAVADHFVENDPGDQIKPPVDTKVLVTYDDKNLYLAFFCYDNPEDVRASYCERDRINSDDNIGFFFDTYGEATWSYMFNVNPYGFQYDAIGVDGYGEDGGFDLVWQSEGQITDSGWQVEVAMPFSGLRFPNIEEQEWRIEFWRHYSRDSYHSISWAAYDRDESCWRCNWGTMTGIKNIEPGKGVEILASAIGFQSGALNQISIDDDGSDIFPDTLRFHNEDMDGDASLGIKYAPSSNFTLEAAINPDFSQVEADADQIDVNSTTALFFPEKRPFFQEGIDIFRSQFNAVYTRMINDPFIAAKATVRIGRTSIGYMGAFDEKSPVMIPFDESSSPVFNADSSFTNIIRVRQTFGDNSQVGFLATDRRFKGGGSGSIASIDGNIRINGNFTLRGQVIATRTNEPDDATITLLGSDPQMSIDPVSNDTSYYNYYEAITFDGKHTPAFDGESFTGHGLRAAINYNDRNLNIQTSYWEFSPTFRLDNGFEPRNNRRQVNFNSGYQLRYDEGIIETIRPSIMLGRVWNFDGQIKDEWVNFSCDLSLRKLQIGYHPLFMLSRENYAGIQFDDIWNVHNCFSITPSGNFSLHCSIDYGHRIARGARIMGYETTGGALIDFRPTNRIRIETDFRYTQSRAADSTARYNKDDMLFKGFLMRNKLSVQYNRELSVRFVVQYNDFSKSWDIDPLVTYRLTPFSLFYIGTTYDFMKYSNLNNAKDMILPASETGHAGTKLGSRQFFMKLQYLFQL